MLQFRCLHLNVHLNIALIYIVSTKWRFTRQKPNELAILEYICIWLLRSNLFLVNNTTIVKHNEGKLHSVWTKVDLQNLYDVCASLGLKDTWKCLSNFLLFTLFNEKCFHPCFATSFFLQIHSSSSSSFFCSEQWFCVFFSYLKFKELHLGEEQCREKKPLECVWCDRSPLCHHFPPAVGVLNDNAWYLSE